MNAPSTITFKLSIPVFLFDQCRERPTIFMNLWTAQQIAQIKAFVFDNLDDKDGAPEVEQFRISFFKYDEERGKGTFRLHFYINRRFCCSDVESSQQDYIDFQFSYVNETLKATASYFNWDVV